MDVPNAPDRDRARGFRIEPAAFYAAKAAATRLRSLAWAARSRGRHSPGLRILYYHRISDERDELAVQPRRFRKQMEYLAAGGYRGVDVVEAARLLAGNGNGDSDGRIVGLSFDDGYRDVAENALPVLEEQGFRATVFLATGVIDGTAKLAWYDRQPPMLTWDDVARLDGGVFGFEAHTITHPNLVTLGEREARAEIEESKAGLEERLGRTVTAFCYPAGVFGERERRLVHEAGFTSATSCDPGANDQATDPLALRRIQIDARDRLVDFRAKVGGGLDRPLPLRTLVRRRRYGT